MADYVVDSLHCSTLRGSPIQIPLATDVVRYRNCRKTQKSSFTGRRNGAGNVSIGPQITAPVDASEQPRRVWCQAGKCDARAIGRRAVDAEPIGSHLLDFNSFRRGYAVAHGGVAMGGRNHHQVTPGSTDPLQGREAGRVDTVIVGQDDLHE